MSDAAHSSTPSIPYRNGVKPAEIIYPAPTPFALSGPQYRHPDFTSDDPRMRPVAPPVMVRNDPPAYLVTEQTFPTLYRDFMEMRQRAQVSGYSFFLSDKISPWLAEIDYGSKQITFSLAAMNRYPYDGVIKSIGHELGHAWRRHHVGPWINFHQDLPDIIKLEMEANLLSVCITGSKQPFLHWLTYDSHTSAANYPTNKQIKKSIEALDLWEDCPVPPPTPKLLQHRQKQRR